MKTFLPSSKRLSLLLAVCSCGLAGILPARAIITNVDIINFAFTNDPVTINVNDTVHWIWEGDFHSTTSTNATPLWDSGVLNTGATYDYTFTNAGNFGYLCTVHLFTGTINVLPIGTTNVIITNFFFAPDPVTITAGQSVNWIWLTAAHSTTSTNATPLWDSGVFNTGHSYFHTFETPGSFGYLCTVHRFTGTINVIPPGPITLSSPLGGAPAGFQFDYSTTPGLQYVVDRATALPLWTPVRTNTATATEQAYLDAAPPPSGAIYRVRQQTGP